MNLFPYITLNDPDRQTQRRFMLASIVCWNKTPKGSRVATVDGEYHFVAESAKEIDELIKGALS